MVFDLVFIPDYAVIYTGNQENAESVNGVRITTDILRTDTESYIVSMCTSTYTSFFPDTSVYF